MAAKKEQPETFACKDDGTILIGIGGPPFRLRRPKVGQFLGFQERWTADVQASITEGAEAVEGDPGGLSATEHAILDWWRNVVAELDAAGEKLPDDDGEMPAWLVNVELVTESFAHWRTVPWAPGSKPSEKALAANMKQIQPLLAASQGS